MIKTILKGFVASVVLSSSLFCVVFDMGGKYVVNIDYDANLVYDNDAINIDYLIEQTRKQQARFLSPASTTPLSYEDAVKYCFSLKSSDLSINGSYLTRNISISDETIINRGKFGSGFIMPTKNDLMFLRHQNLDYVIYANKYGTKNLAMDFTEETKISTFTRNRGWAVFSDDSSLNNLQRMPTFGTWHTPLIITDALSGDEDSKALNTKYKTFCVKY